MQHARKACKCHSRTVIFEGVRGGIQAGKVSMCPHVCPVLIDTRRGTYRRGKYTEYVRVLNWITNLAELLLLKKYVA